MGAQVSLFSHAFAPQRTPREDWLVPWQSWEGVEKDGYSHGDLSTIGMPSRFFAWKSRNPGVERGVFVLSR